MHFSASTALGLGLLAAHATAIVVPVKRDVGLSLPVTVTVTDTLLPVTVTVTTPVTVTAALVSSATLGNNSTTTSGTNSTTISSTASVTSTTSIATTTTTTILLAAVSTASAVPATTTTPTTPPTAGLTADQQRALDLHNSYRAEVGSPPLTWDAGLAESAQAWADHLTTVGKLEHDKNPGGQGENLALQSGGTETFYANGVQRWLDEKSLYDGQPIRTEGARNYHDYGHYTQAIWKSTTKVGLALATDAKGTTYVVARYTPAGNFIGQMPY
ncbi:Ectin [Colletotrichum tanaceti]|uniref:Ectin n=1 Tax=Colletotrichum tanaceti TaxID=1306861 RepID=A0A4U6XE80_9PEZI|nr:Ectin [Colletotrichum tanaceti]